MSMLLEHDYISLSEVPSMVTSEKVSSTVTTTTISTDNNNSERNCATGLNLKATELRLGLPGSESPERTATVHKEIVEDKNVYPHGLLKSLVSGAKRGFSDTIDIGSAKWVFSGTGGSEVDFIKNGGLFSPRGKNGGNQVTVSEVNGQQLGLVTLAAASDGVAKFSRPVQDKKPQLVPASSNGHGSGPASKAQVVGWPPIRSFRKNTMANNPPKNDDNLESKIGSGCLYVKVSMDGAPYLRKLDLQTCRSYVELSSALEKMFSCFTSGQCCADGVTNRDEMNESRMMDLLHGSEYVLTFEDKDGDWMLVGDVPWEMFTETCKRLRIMKSSEAIGLAPRAMEKCKNRN